MSKINVTALAAIIFSASLPTTASAEPYRLGCLRPQFPVRPIDNSCPNERDSDPTTPKGKQNLVKNNLCRVGDPVVLSFADFMSLHRQAEQMHIPFGADGSAIIVWSISLKIVPSCLLGNLRVNGQPIHEGDKVSDCG